VHRHPHRRRLFDKPPAVGDRLDWLPRCCLNCRHKTGRDGWRACFSAGLPSHNRRRVRRELGRGTAPRRRGAVSAVLGAVKERLRRPLRKLRGFVLDRSCEPHGASAYVTEGRVLVYGGTEVPPTGSRIRNQRSSTNGGHPWISISESTFTRKAARLR
jgi:hypothetical protein